MRRIVALLAVGTLAFSACATANRSTQGTGSSASGTRTASPRGSPGASSSTSPHGSGGHYAGPAVAFDYPAGWHEFNLSVPYRFFAAYGPVRGGKYDYVAIAPVPSEMKGLPPEQILAPGRAKAGPMQRVDVNGMPGYSIPVSLTKEGPARKGEVTLVRGRQGEYLVSCLYGEHMKGLVPIGCKMLKNTLVEVPPPTITESSGCTEAELALLRSVPMPGGTDPGTMKVYRHGEGRMCDLLILSLKPKAGIRGDLVAYYTSRLKDAGWHIDIAKVVEPGYEQKWRVLADRDWDWYLVEIYVDTQGGFVPKGAVENFFITVVDG